jgi:hypothetical protein
LKPIYLSEKDPEEVIVLTCDFGPDLAAGETLNAPPTVTVTVASGADASPGDVLDGAAQLDASTTKVLQKVKGGVDDTNYRVKVKATTSDGRTLVLAPILPVRNA